MNEPDAAVQYNQELTHLVGQHGADADLLIGYALNLAQIRWAHFDTHAALEIAGVRPPDGHMHPTLPDPGGPGQPEVSFRPFLPSPAMAPKALPLSAPGRYPAWPDHTGLPQTRVCPPMNNRSDVTSSWPAEAVEFIVSSARREPWRRLPGQVIADYRSELKDLADAAASRWKARTLIPAESASPALTPTIERAASALAPERLHANTPGGQPGLAHSSRPQPSQRVTANASGDGDAATRKPRSPHALAAESFPQDRPQGLRPDNSAGTSSGQSAHSNARRQPGQSPRATTRRGRS